MRALASKYQLFLTIIGVGVAIGLMSIGLFIALSSIATPAASVPTPKNLPAVAPIVVPEATGNDPVADAQVAQLVSQLKSRGWTAHSGDGCECLYPPLTAPRPHVLSCWTEPKLGSGLPAERIYGYADRAPADAVNFTLDPHNCQG